jgi:hypothetical protein
MKMSKIKDDWMNSEKSVGYSAKNYKPKPFIIQRLKAPPICSWVGAPPRAQWEIWTEFATEKERDADLKRLRDATEWRLRPAYQTIVNDQILDVEVQDEEDDLLARLEFLRNNRKNQEA